MIANTTQHQLDSVALSLEVTDRECIDELVARNEGRERDFFALSALRVGMLSLRHAAGVVDRQGLRSECDQLVATMRQTLNAHYEKTTGDISNVLQRYFDVNNGSLLQRLDRLVKKDGELEGLLSRHVGDGTSSLAVNLERHLGPESPIRQVLSVDRGKGLLAALNEVIIESVKTQNEAITGEFTLDNEESALSRLVSKITDENGQLRKEFSDDLDSLRKEFSLDNENGSLCRLIRQVDQSRRAIVAEFSPENESSILSRIGKLLESTNDSIRGSLTLDDENSPLSRLKKELVGAVDEVQKSNAEFHTEIREALASITAKRAEAKRSTQHGNAFHDEVGSFMEHEAQRVNDICELTGEIAGVIPRCKKGDAVITLGPESSAPGVRIVAEAKSDKSYTLKKALDEIQVARENREASHGIFVFSTEAAPDGMEPLNRFGSDIVVIWDAENPASDVNLRAALSIARFIAIDKAKDDGEKQGDRLAIETAIQSITRQLDALADIQKLATTVRNNGEKIVSKANRLNAQVCEQLDAISDHVTGL